ncbi:MAG: glycosyltransferase, partial [Parasporobacterium sp.]|nr:glycosyltransferase [Parasporobacterium sp.]
MNIAVILPVLNPDEKFAAFVKKLVSSDYKTIVVVNDGSAPEYVHYFEEAAENPEVMVLTHEVNKGKGAGLKTAFRYLFEERPDIEVAVTCDGDGQHTVESMQRCIDAFQEHPDSVIIGGRDFSNKNIPARSRFGNTVSSVIYRFACGIKL